MMFPSWKTKHTIFQNFHVENGRKYEDRGDGEMYQVNIKVGTMRDLQRIEMLVDRNNTALMYQDRLTP